MITTAAVLTFMPSMTLAKLHPSYKHSLLPETRQHSSASNAVSPRVFGRASLTGFSFPKAGRTVQHRQEYTSLGSGKVP